MNYVQRIIHGITDYYFLLIVFTIGWSSCANSSTDTNIQSVVSTEGLVAFWDFEYAGDTICGSRYDPKVVDQSFEVKLKRINDPGTYVPASWPFRDLNSQILYDKSGPFGQAIRFNLGFIYGEVNRSAFDQTPLDLNGAKPFTIIAWVKFIGERHMVAGIWDEGGWNPYQGRRQTALFAGLFGQPGVIAHVSATGAASFPQSSADGAQYARLRAIDGQAFDNQKWIAMALTFDPTNQEVTAYLNGTMTPLSMTDPIAQDVFQYSKTQPANPFKFPNTIYSADNFLIKYNGYLHNQDGIAEHSLQVDLESAVLTYGRHDLNSASNHRFRVLFTVIKEGQSSNRRVLVKEVISGDTLFLPEMMRPAIGDTIETSLQKWHDGQWQAVGTPIQKQVLRGAPFTFGRALGLGSDNIDHGSQLYLDGVAVFNRVLSENELKALSF